MLAEVYAVSTITAVTTQSIVQEAPHSSETWQAHAKYTHLKSGFKCMNYTYMKTCNSVSLFTTQAHFIWFYIATVPSSKQAIH